MKTYCGRLAVTGDFDMLYLDADDDDNLSFEPLCELLQWINGKQVNVRYWITTDKATKDEAVRSHLYKLFGQADVEYDTEYSDYTGQLSADELLNVGGHNLLDELKAHDGKYLILEISEAEAPITPD